MSESARLVWSTIVEDPLALRLACDVPCRRTGVSGESPL